MSIHLQTFFSQHKIIFEIPASLFNINFGFPISTCIYNVHVLHIDRNDNHLVIPNYSIVMTVLHSTTFFFQIQMQPEKETRGPNEPVLSNLVLLIVLSLHYNHVPLHMLNSEFPQYTIAPGA